MNPKIVALTLSCGGVKTIGETIHSFNLQTYSNRHLIILDTHPQHLQFDAALPDNIEVVKKDSRLFKSLGDKTRYALDLAKARGADFVAQFEHDDIFLPHHLSSLADAAGTHNRHGIRPIRVGHRKHFSSLGGVDGEPMTLRLDENMCWSRFAFEHCNGHYQQAKDDPYDACYMALGWEYCWLPNEQLPGYIYRWGNGQHHMSGWYGNGMTHEQLYRYAEDQFGAVDISGKIVEIGWRHDYVSLCKEVFKPKRRL